MNLRTRKCSVCGEQKDEVEFSGYYSGSRPCKACESRRVINARWHRIALIKLRQEVEIEEKRLEQKKRVLAERMEAGSGNK